MLFFPNVIEVTRSYIFYKDNCGTIIEHLLNAKLSDSCNFVLGSPHIKNKVLRKLLNK